MTGRGAAAPVSRLKRHQAWLMMVVITVLTIWSAVGTGFSPFALVSGFGEIISLLTDDFFPPDFTKMPNLIRPALETVYMSFVGSMTGAALAVGGALLAARTTNPLTPVRVAVRGLASALRNIPALIWAIILVASFGLGTMVGTIALVISSAGLLTRAYAEVLEEIDLAQVEALKAVGANYLQIVGQAVMPQVLPGLTAWTLYLVEINIRASTIVGMVGGGGIGFVIQSGIKLFHFQEVCMAVLVVFALVWGTEWLTGKIREWLL